MEDCLISAMVVITRAYKTELAPNNEQVTTCRKHAGAARYAYNWGLQRKQEVYRTTAKSLSAIDLHRELNALKKSEAPWMYEVSKCAPQEALRNLDTALAHFLRRCKLKRLGTLHGKVGYPRLKTKKRGLGSFRLTGSITVFPNAIQWPRLGLVRRKERNYLPSSGVKRRSQLPSRSRLGTGTCPSRWSRSKPFLPTAAPWSAWTWV